MHAALEPGDAAPLEPVMATPNLAQWATWSGHRCRSGFVASTAAESTVSFDFRVIPWSVHRTRTLALPLALTLTLTLALALTRSVYREDRANAKRSNHNLRLGSYYAIMDRTDVEGEQGVSEPSQNLRVTE